MMRYSEIPRDLSSDSLRFVEYGEEYIYENLRDESPPSDVPPTNERSLIRNSIQSNSKYNYEQLAPEPLQHDKHDEREQLQLLERNQLYYQQQQLQNNECKQRKDSTKPNNSYGGTIESTSNSRYYHKNDENHYNTLSTPSIKCKHSRRKNSIGSACINVLSSSPGSGCYYNYGSTPTSKTQSLPPNSTIKDYDSVILSALRVSPDDLANQITLLDFPIFAAIQPDELTSCSWTKKDKHLITPNIVAFTKRFNHTSFWTVQEILSADNHKERAEILTHFIKVAKKLFELNNLHSLFAIISAMQSASIYRLKKTWSCISKKDKQTFDRLANVFSDNNNWENLRGYLESLRLPCIPYLGLFLTDLIYIDLAHPHKGGLEPEQRRNKMNNILRVISNYQQSDYSHIQAFDKIIEYLKSIRYIEELQNIFEEDQYKRSLKLEPSSTVPSSSSCSSKESFNVDIQSLACLNLSPAKAVGSMRLSKSSASSYANGNVVGNKFIPTHRKCRSLGSKFRSTSLPRNFYQKCNCPNIIASGIGTISNKRCKCRIFGKMNSHQNAVTSSTNEHMVKDSVEHVTQSRHLLDDSFIEDINDPQHYQSQHQQRHQHPHLHHNNHHHHQQSQYQIDAKSVESCDSTLNSSIYLLDKHHLSTNSAALDNLSISSLDSITTGNTGLSVINNLQGCVRRKTILKDGRKPAVASWQRYWLQIWANSLVYFPPKSFKGSERCDFKREPCKICLLDGWSAKILDNPKHKNSFEIVNPTNGTIYKFRTDCERLTNLWVSAIRYASTQKNNEKTLPVNLMSFE